MRAYRFLALKCSGLHKSMAGLKYHSTLEGVVKASRYSARRVASHHGQEVELLRYSVEGNIIRLGRKVVIDPCGIESPVPHWRCRF